jgi:hypothetical protein
MRVLFVVAPLVLGIVGAIAAFAADDPNTITRNHQRVQPQPQYPHYYPMSGIKPKIGRAEELSAPSSAVPEPDKTYKRQY